ncbi:MAG: hypothetical protein Q9167_005076 [Letrouitia subvulpina]
METSEDKQWATKYLLDPLTAPEPSQETGPGTHYRSTVSSNANRQSSASASSQKKKPSASVRETTTNPRNSYPSPPSSASPKRERLSKTEGKRRDIASTSETSSTNRRSVDQASTQIPTSTDGRASSTTTSTRPRRTSSLSARYEGDCSHRPLDVISHEQKLANRAPHLRKTQHIGSDSIDHLDVAGGVYHHEGPYDVSMLARNAKYKNSPLEAVAASNQEALKATPKERVIDSIRQHRPLDGVAMVPPGQSDRGGRYYNYEEGTDVMIEEGNYKRWPGVNYLPSDLKGKGEPSYSLERSLKDHKAGIDHRRVASDGQPVFEMSPTTSSRPSLQHNQRSSSFGTYDEGQQRYAEWESERRRESAGGKGLRKRFGSLKVSGKV